MKEDSLREIAEAESKGWDCTAHGSFESVREHIRIYEEWEKRGSTPVRFGIFTATCS